MDHLGGNEVYIDCMCSQLKLLQYFFKILINSATFVKTMTKKKISM